MKTFRIAIVLSMIQYIQLFAGDNGQVLQTLSRYGIKVTQNENSIYKLEYPNGKVLYNNLGNYRDENLHRTMSSVDSTIINLQTIDTSLYSNKYTFWQEVPVSDGDFRPLIVGDVNNNGMAELYGYQKYYSTPELSFPMKIFELNPAGSFDTLFTFPDTTCFAQNIYDIKRNGSQELVMYDILVGAVYKPNSENGLPTDLDFAYGRGAGQAQINKPTLGDFDKDGFTDIVYDCTPTISNCFIDEYNPSTNTFDSVYRYNPQDYIQGYSVGDFDMDGKTDIVFGSSQGHVHVIESQGPRQYADVWDGQVETYNAYLHFSTNDIDGNGKPEFWVGGDAYYDGVGITRFTCFESNGEHSYVPVARIDLVGVFSFFAGNCFAKDIDGDGKEEILICIDGHVIILKFVGTPNHHAYDIFYLKENELANFNGVYFGATLHNLTTNDRDDLFISLGQLSSNNTERQEFSYIYKPDFFTEVKDRPSLSIPKNFELFQNYPNPFNPTTTIEYSIPSNTFVTLKVFDLLGRVVATVVNQKQNAGQHFAKFDGTFLASGIYFYRLQAADLLAVKKLILLK